MFMTHQFFDHGVIVITERCISHASCCWNSAGARACGVTGTAKNVLNTVTVIRNPARIIEKR